MSVPATNVFGPAVSASDLEAAATETFKKWIGSYLLEFERRMELDPKTLARPRSWSTVNEFSQIDPEQTPAIILVSEGLISAPERRGDGRYDGWFHLGVGVIANARDRASSNELAKVYAAAIRLIFVHKGSLDGFASGLALDVEGYGEVPANYLDVGAAAQVNAALKVNGIAQSGHGPAEPDDDELPADWGVVPDRDHIHIDIELEDRT